MSEAELTPRVRRQWREDAEAARTHSGHIYGDPKRILALLDELDAMEKFTRALDRSDSDWRRAALAPEPTP